MMNKKDHYHKRINQIMVQISSEFDIYDFNNPRFIYLLGLFYYHYLELSNYVLMYGEGVESTIKGIEVKNVDNIFKLNSPPNA